MAHRTILELEDQQRQPLLIIKWPPCCGGSWPELRQLLVAHRHGLRLPHLQLRHGRLPLGRRREGCMYRGLFLRRPRAALLLPQAARKSWCGHALASTEKTRPGICVCAHHVAYDDARLEGGGHHAAPHGGDRMDHGRGSHVRWVLGFRRGEAPAGWLTANFPIPNTACYTHRTYRSKGDLAGASGKATRRWLM